MTLVAIASRVSPPRPCAETGDPGQPVGTVLELGLHRRDR
jgi:hypothetical protein